MTSGSSRRRSTRIRRSSAARRLEGELAKALRLRRSLRHRPEREARPVPERLLQALDVLDSTQRAVLNRTGCCRYC
jgi:hypothetical protein